MNLDFITIPAIIAIVYLIALIIKSMSTDEKIDRMIPGICGAIGLALGLLIFFTIPGFMPVTNWAEAAATGIASGFAATGINQIYKQLTKPEPMKVLK
ncbi:MAG: enolase [Pseudobutyrivibrio sp.]|nr:enolase [Pseudobutyrivibrio sp.]